MQTGVSGTIRVGIYGGAEGTRVELEGRKFETADFKAAQKFSFFFFFSGRAGTCQEPGDFILFWETPRVGMAVPILRARKQ